MFIPLAKEQTLRYDIVLIESEEGVCRRRPRASGVLVAGCNGRRHETISASKLYLEDQREELAELRRGEPGAVIRSETIEAVDVEAA